MVRRLISWLLVIVVAANLGAILPVHAHNMAPTVSSTGTAAGAPMHVVDLQKTSSTPHHIHCQNNPSKPANDCRCCCCAVCSSADLPLPTAHAGLTPPPHVERSRLYVAELRIGSFSGRIERPPKANA